ncbi:MAG: thioredoxin domain-containing protein [Bacteroidetes bacterium]|nr:thioredoxin domain-containing protein [Bacteroidota bacterium]
MQKFIFTTLIIITLSLSDGFSQNRTIRFNEKPWQEIVAMARAEKKLIFLDAFASWCGPCKWMAANMFTNDTIADYYNKTFINAHFDMEKGEGLTLRKKFAVRAYPSLVFINPNTEEMVHERVGAPQKVRDYLDMAVVAQNPEECLSNYIKKYNEGSSSPEFIKTYLVRLSEAYMPVTDVLKKYFSTQSESALLGRTDWNLIYRFITEMNDPMFEFLLAHRKEYAKLYTKDSVNSKISEVYLNAFQKFARNPNTKLVDSNQLVLKQKIIASGFEDAGKVNFSADLALYQMRGKNKEFLELAYNDLDKYYSDDYNMLNNMAWSFYSMTVDVKYLEKALSWSKQSVSLRREPFNLDTYATILFKLGKKEEAIKQEKEAIALAKKTNATPAQYEDALKRMENSK